MDLAKVIHCLKLLSRCKVHYRAFDDVKLLTPGYQIPPNPGAVLILNSLHESLCFKHTLTNPSDRSLLDGMVTYLWPLGRRAALKPVPPSLPWHHPSDAIIGCSCNDSMATPLFLTTLNLQSLPSRCISNSPLPEYQNWKGKRPEGALEYPYQQPR